MALSMMLAVGLSVALAGDGTNVNPRVLNAFKKEFVSAQDVSWRNSENYFVATFSYNRQWISAYFSEDGDLLGTARNLIFSQLPIAVMKEITERYRAEDVSGIFEFNEGSESNYYMNVKQGNKTLLVKASPGGTVSVIRRVK